MKFLISMAAGVILLCGLLWGARAWADCRSDCQEDYNSEVSSCREQFDDPDDADELKICLDNALSEYNTCVNECENE